jgi:hypothetical protein
MIVRLKNVKVASFLPEMRDVAPRNIQLKARLPDGAFSNQKSKFWKILGNLSMEDDGLFYVPLVYFIAIWYILWPSGIFYCHLVYFCPFWYVIQRKIWQPRLKGKFFCERGTK